MEGFEMPGEGERWTFHRWPTGATVWKDAGPPFERNIEVVPASLYAAAKADLAEWQETATDAASRLEAAEAALTEALDAGESLANMVERHKLGGAGSIAAIRRIRSRIEGSNDG